MDYIKVFQEECDGFSHEYTSATIINATLEQVVETAKEYCEKGHSYYRSFDDVFSNGKVNEDGSISFIAYREDPDCIAKFFSTHLSDSVVFADIGWDYHEVYVMKNGKPYKNFSARWDGEEPEGYTEEYDDDDTLYYDCDVILKDNESGIEFFTGGGMCTEDEFKYFQKLINNNAYKN